MHARAAVTLLTVVWFSGCTPMSGQERPEAPAQAEKMQVDIFSLQERARHGDVKAADRLGWFYMTGTGVPRNYSQAAQWYLQSAKQGLAEAEFALGFLYEQGEGVSRDYRKAVLYYTAAANQGHTTAENNLASMYEHGQGVPKDLQKAVRWYQAAAEQGEVTAECNLASLYFSGKGVAQSYSEAAAWFRAAAELGFAPAQENLGWAYYTGAKVQCVTFPRQPNGLGGLPTRDMLAHNSTSGTCMSRAKGCLWTMSAPICGTRLRQREERNGPERD